MADKDIEQGKDFIVVGGRRRWFTVPGKDDRFTRLQRQLSHQRKITIPEGPSEAI